MATSGGTARRPLCLGSITECEMRGQEEGGRREGGGMGGKGKYGGELKES